MSPMRYKRVGSKKYCYYSSSSSSSSSSSCQGFRGFRLNPRRFSVQRLRTKFLSLMKIFSKWRNSYGNALQSLRRSLGARNGKRNLGVEKEEMYFHGGCSSRDHDCTRLKSFARTNSFYTEAIADCLDFIKRNSLSMDENPGMNGID